MSAPPLFHRMSAVLVAVLALLYVAGWPGAVLHEVSVELTAPEVPKTVKGRDGILDVVVTGTGRGPLVRARVRAFAILDGKAHAAGAAETDATGRATLTDLPAAEHWVVAEASGHARASQMVAIVAGARRLDLELGPEHTLEVEVKNEQGAPVAGAEIETRGPDPFPVGARTDASGLAQVTRLGEGPWTVTARAPGFEEATRRRVPEGERLTIVLGKQGALLVEVATEDGAPAPGAKVLLDASVLGAPRVAEAGKEGRVRISGLDRGSYALRATHGAKVSPIELGIVLDKGEERAVKLVLQQGVMIAVHVTDAATEEDVHNARITLAEGGLSPFPIEGVSDKRGRATLGPILHGAATLSARADDYVPRSAVAIDEEAPQQEVKIALARGGALVGRVVDARGDSIDGATIRVVGTDLEGMPIDEDPARASFREAHFAARVAGPTALVPAGELGVMPGPVPPIPRGPIVQLGFGDVNGLPTAGAGNAPRAEPWVSGRGGEFRAHPVPPGRVRALVHHPQYVDAMSETVTLESNKEARVTVVLGRGGLLEGRVVDSRGRGIEGAHVTALATHGSLEHMSRTGSDGSFAFAALPDAIVLLVARDEDPTAIVARVEVTVPEGGKKRVDVTLPEPRPALVVKVTDTRGSAIEAAQVSAVSLDANEALRVTAWSDARGEARLAGARGVALRVEAHAPGRAGKVLTTTAEIESLKIELGPAEGLTGEVTTKRREPIAGAKVTLQTEAGVRHARTNKEGVYTFGEIAPGPARLRVRAAGRAPAERAVTIEERGGRKPSEVPRVELAEEAIVEGVVVDTRGDPVAGARVAKDSVPTYLPVGAAPTGMAVTDGKGRFRLTELAEGMITLEAYAADIGRTRKSEIRAWAGRTTDGVKLVIARGSEASSREPVATGGVAVTLGETDTQEVVVVAVTEGSEAERGGLAVDDVLVDVGGAHVTTIAEARARLSGPVNDDVLIRLKRGDRALTLRVPREPVRR
ncbi:MAG: carboxypeptidase regulatory-like domain-containing protein [Labilithrix sp.]|nr:carboxypeptidase regulatory-like domain-containing protein [Labilithrix sp.]MCW5811082.1 carboxypeptidase regulatory-like domain-containing protein [Labilithrix sp.]